jgi:hypothetical protein
MAPSSSPRIRSISPLNWRIFAERGFAAIASSISLSAFRRFRPAQQLREPDPWLCRARIQPDRIAQHRSGLVPIAHTGCRGTKRRPDLAFESGVPITRFDHIENVGEFFLSKQGLRKNRQIVCFIAVACARGFRLALGRLGIAELELNLGEPRAKRRILWRLANGVAQLELGGFEVSLCEVLLGILGGGGTLLRKRGRGDGGP